MLGLSPSKNTFELLVEPSHGAHSEEGQRRKMHLAASRCSFSVEVFLALLVGRSVPSAAHTHTERERDDSGPPPRFIHVLPRPPSVPSSIARHKHHSLSPPPFRSSVRPTDRSLAFPENGGGRRGRTMPPPPPPFLLRDCPLLRHSLPRVLGPPPPTEVGVCLRFPLSSSRNCMRTTARQRRRRSRLLRTYIVLGAATGNNQIRKHGKEKRRRRRRRRRSERCSLPLLWRIQYMSPGRMGGSRFHAKAEKRAKRKEEEEEAIFGPLLLFLGNK